MPDTLYVERLSQSHTPRGLSYKCLWENLDLAGCREITER